MLDAAASHLLTLVGSVTVEKLATLARDARTELDLGADNPDAIADREQALRDKRTFHVWRRPDGMIAANGLFAPEAGAILLSAFDAATSPRRGGPRLVASDRAERAERLLADERTTEQIAADAFIELVRLGRRRRRVCARSSHPAVQLIVTDHDLPRTCRSAHIEGQSSQSVSGPLSGRLQVRRGADPVRCRWAVIDVGRTMRSTRGSIGLAARDGGCRSGL